MLAIALLTITAAMLFYFIRSTLASLVPRVASTRVCVSGFFTRFFIGIDIDIGVVECFTCTSYVHTTNTAHTNTRTRTRRANRGRVLFTLSLTLAVVYNLVCVISDDVIDVCSYKTVYGLATLTIEN